MPKFTVLKSTKSEKSETWTITLQTEETFGPITLLTKYYMRGAKQEQEKGKEVDIPVENLTTVLEQFTKDGKTFTCRWIMPKNIA